MRVGDKKLVREGLHGEWELYDMATDRTEQHNLADKYPETVQELAEMWNQWGQRVNLLPYDWKSR